MSTFSTRFDAGDVVEIFFPFADGEGGKKRPALIVTAPDARADFLALAITGAAQHDHSVPLGNHDLAAGKLGKASYLRADKVFTVNAEAISQSFGKVKPAFLDKARRQMCIAVGCRQS